MRKTSYDPDPFKARYGELNGRNPLMVLAYRGVASLEMREKEFAGVSKDKKLDLIIAVSSLGVTAGATALGILDLTSISVATPFAFIGALASSVKSAEHFRLAIHDHKEMEFYAFGTRKTPWRLIAKPIAKALKF